MDIYVQTVGNRACAAGVPQTLIQLVTPSTVRAQVTKLSISFDGGTSTAEPCDVFLSVEDSAGTSSAGTVAKNDTSAPTALVTTRVGFSSTEPAYSNEVLRVVIHPQGGLYELNWEIGDRTAPFMAVSTRLGLIVNAPANVNATAAVAWAE